MLTAGGEFSGNVSGDFVKENELSIEFWSKFDRRIVFLDFETTGISFDSDRIIEIGALAISKNGRGEEFSTFVDPGVPLPPAITSLTGITDEMLAGAPKIGEVSKKFCEFVDGAIIFAHNANFEKNFIQRHLSEARCADFVDTCEIAILLMPALKYFNLEKILNFFNIKESEDHRALIDALDTYFAMNHLVSRVASSYTAERIETVAEGVSEFDGGATGEFFKNLLAAHRECRKKKAKKGGGKKRRDSADDGQNLLRFSDEPRLSESLAAAGTAGGESSLQSAVVGSLVAAFSEGKYLMLEIPHGINRSACILHAAALHAKRTHEKVFIFEPHHNHYIEEIARRHAPAVSDSFSGEVKIFVLRDPENYVCMHNLNELYASAETREEKLFNLYIKSYIASSPDSGLENIAPFLFNKYPGLREKFDYIKAANAHCHGAHCPFAKECFFNRAVKGFLNSDVVATPFAAFFKWKELAPEAVPKPFNAVIDHAHRIEEAFAESFAIRFGRPEITDTLFDCSEFLARIAGDGAAGQDAEKALKVSEYCIRSAADFFSYSSSITSGRSDSRDAQKIGAPTILLQRVFEDTLMQETFLEKAINFSINLIQLEKFLAATLASLVRAGENQGNYEHGKAYLAGRYFKCAKRFRQYFCSLIHCVDSTYTAYLKYDQYSSGWLFCAEPVDVGRILAQKLFTDARSVAFVSSALTVNMKYDFIKWILGLQKYKNLEVVDALRTYASVPHSLMVPKEMPAFDAKNTGPFVAKLAETIVKIASKKAGKTMVLFNSIDRMNQVFMTVQKELAGTGIACFRQRSEAEKSKTLHKLRRTPNCVVLGSQSLMDFADMDDESVDTLIIERLPFPFFEDPKVLARKRLALESGRLEFEDYILPKAILKVKQTVGRLRGSRNGEGLLVIADSKLIGMNYLRDLYNSIPVCKMFYTFEEYWRELN